MTRGSLRLKVIAVAVAYAVALQGLFAAFAPHAAAAPWNLLCSGQAVDQPAVPAGHDEACAAACVMAAAGAAPLPPDAVIGVQVASAIRQSAFVAPWLDAPPRGLPTARAPPFV